MHILLNYDGGLPAFVHISDGKTGDNTAAYRIDLQAGAVVVADRYYGDFKLLKIWDSKGAYFVVRHKDNLSFESIKQRPLCQKQQPHILKDEHIKLTVVTSASKYPKQLRR